jgi:transcription elongation factor Elf1
LSGVGASLEGKITDRIASMVFLCLYCDSNNSATLSVVDFDATGASLRATAFFICSDCKNKFMIKIEDLGKIR